MNDPNAFEPPSLQDIREARATLGRRVVHTPTWRWQGPTIDARFGDRVAVWLKLELFQRTGTFKPRGALLNVLALTPEQLERGVTAVSAGNHAIAVGYAAQTLGTTAKVVMPKTANPARLAACRAYDTEIVLVDDVHRGFEEVRRIEAEEGRTLVHPFEGKLTATGTATVGLELASDVPDLDAVLVPIGGGGLCAGVATAIKYLQPKCKIIGVEPEGADTMHRSFASGKVESIDRVRTIADSLGAPHTAPYSLALCRRFVDELVYVDDDQLRSAMKLLFQELKLAVEPAGAATTAALFHTLATRDLGKNVALLVCGSNIDAASFAAHVAAAPADQ